MSFIKPIETDKAVGLLARIYDAALKRAGKVFQILRVQSNNADSLKASMDLYAATMLRRSPLSRAQREMLAVVVSKVNGCHYWTLAHRDDLRAEVNSKQFANAVADDYTTAKLTDLDRGLCDYAKKLTETPADVTQADVDRLRSLGLDDRAITDACQTIAYFNYINRIADGLGVDLEPEMAENADDVA